MRIDSKMESNSNSGPPRFALEYSQHPPEFLPSNSESDSLPHFDTPDSALPSAYTTEGAMASHQRHGTAASSSFSTIPSMRHPYEGRYDPQGGLAPDAGQTRNSFSDQIPGSILPSPTPRFSQYTNTTVHTGSVYAPGTLPAPLVPVLQPAPSFPSIYREAVTINHSTPDHFSLPQPDVFRVDMQSPDYTGHRTTSHHTTLPNRPHYPLPSYPIHGSPRTVFPSPIEYPGSPRFGQMPSPRPPLDAKHLTHENITQRNNHECKWLDLTRTADLICEGRLVDVDIQAQLEKGFCYSHADKGYWFTYRRNYLFASCSYSLSGITNGSPLYLRRNNSQERVHAIAVRLSACVDGSDGKIVELIQYTAKRDNGPKYKVRPYRLSPKLPNTTAYPIQPNVPYGSARAGPLSQNVPGPVPELQHQYEVDPQPTPMPEARPKAWNLRDFDVPAPQSPGQELSHVFERVQFKQATANNGKRRASQQTFRLTVELLVDIRKHANTEPLWYMIAKRSSESCVVRGRSPSHYKVADTVAYEAVVNGTAPPDMSNYHRQGYGPIAPMRQPRSSRRRSNASAGAAMGSSNVGYGPSISYQPTSQYAIQQSPGDSVTPSPTSVNSDNLETDHQRTPGMLSQPDHTTIAGASGYSYYPSTMYEPIRHLPPPRPEGPARYSSDPRSFPFGSEFPNALPGPEFTVNGPFRRYDGFPSSHNLYPDTTGGGGSYS